MAESLPLQVTAVQTVFGCECARWLQDRQLLQGGAYRNARSGSRAPRLPTRGLLSSGILAEDKRGKLIPKIKDLLAKLGQEEDAYYSLMLVMPDYLEREGAAPLASELADRIETDRNDVISQISPVGILHKQAPPAIAAATFFETMIGRMLDNTPVDFHEEAHRLRENAGRVAVVD